MRTIIRLVIALAISLTAPSTLLGQVGPRLALGGQGIDRPEFDYFVGQYRPVEGATAEGAEGAVGARIMWPLSRQPGGSRLLTRTSLGGYFVHSPDDEDWSRTWRYGAQADLRLTRIPVAGRIDPLLSLGVGASRVEAPSRSEEARLREAGARTDLSVSPGVGLRLRLAPGFGLRGDARQVLDFRERVQRNLELSAGLSMGV